MYQGVYSDVTKICYIHLCKPISIQICNAWYRGFGVNCSPEPSASEHLLSYPKPLFGGLITSQTEFWLVVIMVFFVWSTPIPHICASFLLTTLGFRLHVSNPFSFDLVCFTLARRWSLVFRVKLSTILFVHEAELLINCSSMIFIIFLETGYMGSLWDSRNTPLTSTSVIGSKYSSRLYSSAME